MTDPAGPSRGIKVGQRPVKSCNICHRRKVRCDQQIPCSRCIARGIAELCKPETRIVKGQLVGDTPSRRSAEPTFLEILEENKSLHRKIAAQQQLLDELRPGGGAIPGAYGRDRNGRDQSLSVQPLLSTPGPSKRRRMSSEEAQPHHRQTNGHGGLSSHGIAHGDGKREQQHGEEKLEILSSLAQLRGITDWHPSAQAVTPGDDPVLRQTVSLIDPHVSSHLVQFHTSSLLWLHCVYHGPTFWDEHEAWMMERRGEREGRAERSYEYLAVYFAVISSSLFFMDETETRQLGIMPNVVPTLCKLWLGAAFHCLQASEYMTTPSMLALQAICIISLIGHHYGHTSYIASLYTLAIEHATRMGLHRLPKGGVGSGDVMRDELGRRVWTCLTVWESLDLGKFQAGLMYPNAETSPPTNIDDVELHHEPEKEHPGHPYHHTTQVSHLLAMGKLADMFRDLYFALRQTSSLRARYHLVREYADRFARHHLDEWPDLFPVGGAWLPGDPPPTTSASAPLPATTTDPSRVEDGGESSFVLWSRFNWSLLLNGMRLSMYKPFLNLAYTQGGEWTEVREICLSLAQKILANRQTIPTHARWHKAWPVISDTVLAGAIIASEMTYGHHPPPVATALRRQVELCVKVLSELSPPECSIAQRGVWLLTHMLQRRPHLLRSPPPPHLYADLPLLSAPPPASSNVQPAMSPMGGTGGVDTTPGYTLDADDFAAAASWLDEILGTDFDQVF